MCGITGFTGQNDPETLKNMMDSIHHRGPDDFGQYADEYISLGHKRLSIIDLSEAGRNPISNEDESIKVILNGEIYNYKPLREDLVNKNHKFKSNTDTEVLVHAYEEYGISFLEKIDGMFAFALWDANRKELFLVRDRIGIKPLYYSIVNNELFFSSELKSLLYSGAIKRQVNYRPLREFLTVRSSSTEESFIKGVKKLLPGHYLKFSFASKTFSISQYWNLRSYGTSKTPSPIDTIVLDLRSKLVNSVKSHLMSDVPLGVYLSGGIDSSSIVGIMHKEGIEDIKTFTIGFGDIDLNNAVDQASIVAEHFSTDHQHFTVNPDVLSLLPKITWHADEPLADPTIIPTYILSEKTKPKCTVILTGEGADEFFGGYSHYKFINLRKKYFGRFPYFMRYPGSYVAKMMPLGVFQLFFKYSNELGKKGKGRVSELLKSNSPQDWYSLIQSIYLDNEKKELIDFNSLKNVDSEIKIEDFLFTNYLSNFFPNKKNILENTLFFDQTVPMIEDLLMKVDKMTMAYSIEARVPYLDRTIVEFASTLPISYKLNKGKSKYILREAVKPFIPEKTYLQKKDYFFVPIHKWLKTNISTFSDNLLFSDLASKTFNKQYIQNLLTKYDQSPLYYARQLWCLISYELWYRIYIQPSDSEFKKGFNFNL